MHVFFTFKYNNPLQCMEYCLFIIFMIHMIYLQGEGPSRLPVNEATLFVLKEDRGRFKG